MSANSRLAMAAHIVSVLASRWPASATSAEIAGSVNTNPVVVRRILAALARAGIVESGKGKSGGSKLVKCPEDITLWDLSVALGEAHLFSIHKNPENPRCKISCGMKAALGRAFAGAEKAAQDRLRRVTVKELLAGV